MQKEQKEYISLDMTIGDVFSKYPHKSQLLAQTMTNAGLHCTSCSASTWETLEAGMISHGMSPDAMTRLVDKLNEIIEEEVDLTTISLTARAAKKVQEFAAEEEKAGYGLRFGDSSGGCGGFQYILGFDEKPETDDVVFHSEGVEIYVKKGMLGRLLGSTIDYVDGLQGAGFKISNPNVKSSCGCGTSQGY